MITFFILLGIAVALGGVIIGLAVSGNARNRAQSMSEAEQSAKEMFAEDAAEEKASNEVVTKAAEEQAVASEAEPVVAEQPAEVVEEVVEQPAEVVAEAAEEQAVTAQVVEETDEEEEDDDNDEAEEQPERKLVVENGEVKYIIIKYSKSFLAKLIQSNDVTKDYYSQLKNHILSYKGVKARTSWRWETFRKGRKALMRFRLRGKTLSVALALNPDDYAETKYKVESLAEFSSYEDTPCLYKIKNDRRLKYAKELIDKIMQDNEIPAAENAEVDYASQYPYEETEPLIERKLIKVLTDEDAQSGTMFKPSDVRERVTAAEVDSIMNDEVAEILIEKAEEVSDKTKTGIVNIDVLSKVFKDGETVTLEEVKKRVKGFDKKVTYLKVLARGVLDKKLTVKADAFSIQAVKMIVITGGKAIKK